MAKKERASAMDFLSGLSENQIAKNIPINSIRPDPNQPRKEFDEEHEPAQPPTSTEVSGKNETAVDPKVVVLTLTVNEIERLIPFFVDKDKQIEITCNEQIAKELLQNLGNNDIDDSINLTDLIKQLLA